MGVNELGMLSVLTDGCVWRTGQLTMPTTRFVSVARGNGGTGPCLGGQPSGAGLDLGQTTKVDPSLLESQHRTESTAGKGGCCTTWRPTTPPSVRFQPPDSPRSSAASGR